MGLQIKRRCMQALYATRWITRVSRAWLRSLTLMMPNTFVPLFLVTLRSWWHAIYSFWWAILLIIAGMQIITERLLIFTVKSNYCFSLNIASTWWLVSLIMIAMHTLLMTFIVGIARPSVMIKGFAYFLFLVRRGYAILFGVCCISFFGSMLFYSWYVSLAMLYLKIVLALVTIIFLGFFGSTMMWPLGWWYASPLMIFYALFILDDVYSLRKAFMMTLYDYPLCLIITSLLTGGYYATHMAATYHVIGGMLAYPFFYFCMVPFSAMFLVTLYSKRVHENYEEYL